MNREQFINSLLKYLKRIPLEEKLEVERYYNEIFDEASIDKYDEVPNSFGNPKEIALEILTDLGSEVPEINSDNIESPKTSNSYRNSALIIILAILAAPIGIPIAVTIALFFLTLVLGFGTLVLGLVFTAITIVYVAITAQTTFLIKIVSLGAILILIGVIILVIEFFKFIIKKVAGFISKKLQDRRK